ncbi:MAG: MerC domain-containing protein [Alphaproteobacteria bacterium]|nr:MerC domain-containing protein [Alphaproteobacteria bacterium]
MTDAVVMETEPEAVQGGGGWKKRVRLNAALLPSVGAALLPKLTCPACWPAYAGLLSSLGVSFVDYTPYLMPLTGFFLVISVFALAFRARLRRGYGPFALGLASAMTVMVGKFGYDNDPVMYTGLAVLVAASVWNSWPRPRQGAGPDCPACVEAEV